MFTVSAVISVRDGTGVTQHQILKHIAEVICIRSPVNKHTFVRYCGSSLYWTPVVQFTLDPSNPVYSAPQWSSLLCTPGVQSTLDPRGPVYSGPQSGIVQTMECFFPGLAKTKFQGFPGLKSPFFQDFPGHVPFTSWVAQGRKSAYTKSVIGVYALQ